MQTRWLAFSSVENGNANGLGLGHHKAGEPISVLTYPIERLSPEG